MKRLLGCFIKWLGMQGILTCLRNTQSPVQRGEKLVKHKVVMKIVVRMFSQRPHHWQTSCFHDNWQRKSCFFLTLERYRLRMETQTQRHLFLLALVLCLNIVFLHNSLQLIYILRESWMQINWNVFLHWRCCNNIAAQFRWGCVWLLLHSNVFNRQTYGWMTA